MGWLYATLFGIWLVLDGYIFLEIKKIYEKGETLSTNVVIAVWASYILHFVLILWASLKGLWLMPINTTVALVGGFMVIVVGFTIMLLGVLEFRSFKRMSGLNTSKLVTTGIYRYSRNPQNLGLFLIFLGISLRGRSLLALLLTAVFVIGFHAYVVELEEPYLERIFGEEYRRYKERTPRYLGLPR
ncbi:isoprenylcysteine carboxylmethyltransferase family protein [Thermococcus sp. M36]|uniref:methyltransferase family protein n=1 Tax=Thermococcus sp. M36 TaxID=1638261 RepID=UPI00143B1923|nr:isoprenylcysteine carboxylmethyltransferase family protein [Thermococcus sp. M36]NJE04697.1 isoprenylcysteine carboxylmethyltransferase family protein [Thermococcus sp. M36]